MKDSNSEIIKHKHIVVSGDNGNALGVIRSLGEAGIKPILIYLVEETHLPLLIKSRYLTVVHRVYSYEEAIDLLISKYANEDKMPFVYTCDDSVESIIDNRYSEMVGYFYFFNAGTAGRINELMNKHSICELAEKCGFNIPKQEVLNTGELPKTLRYPVITKTLMSIMGAWKEDSYVCHDEQELLNAYQRIQSPKLLVQEYIEKKNELALEGFAINNGKDVCIPYEISFFRFSKGGYGHYMWCKTTENEELLNRLKELIKACHYTGCFEIEFLIDKDDHLWFLEVNFRFSFWNYAVTFGGMNYPLTWAKSVLNNQIYFDTETTAIKPYYTALSEAGDFGQSVVRKKISLWRWLMDIHSADMLYLYNPKDKMPAISFWCSKILRKVLGRLWRQK